MLAMLSPTGYYTAMPGRFVYDASYADFATESFSWDFLERPSFERYLGRVLHPDTAVLDIGCGSGRMAELMVNMGVDEEMITGIDPNKALLDRAIEQLPGAQFLLGEAPNLPFRHETFSCVIANMVLHAVDETGLHLTFERISSVLSRGGYFLFVDTNPYQDVDDLHIGEWVTKQAPWGGEMPVFQHDYKALFDIADELWGLELLDIDTPMPPEESRQVNPSEFARYSAKPYHIAALFTKP